MKLDAFDQLLHEERKLVSLNVPWFTVKYESRNGKRVKVVATDMWGDGSDEFFNMVLLRTKRYEAL